MDRLTGILRCQWRAYWRRLARARSLTAGHQGITLVITVVIFFKYLSLLATARVEMAQGETRLTQTLLAVIFLAWLFLPITSSAAGVPLRRLLHLPLSLRDLFAIRIASLVITPYSWILIVASLAIIYPLAHAPRPWAAVTATLWLIACSCLMGFAIGHLLSVALWRRLLLIILSALTIAAYFLSTRNADWVLHAFILPVDLVTRAAQGRNPLVAISLLLALTLLALGAAWWSLKLNLASTSSRSSRRKGNSILFRLPGATGSLAAKDVRYFRTLLDPYLGIAATALGCFYLLNSAVPSSVVAWIFILIVFLPNASLAFNAFGLDSPAALDRYALMPATGGKIVAAKNLAFVIICTVQVAPIILLTCWRLGLSAGALGLAVAASIAAAYLAWGNWMSVTLPVKMHPYRFAPATGSLPEVMAGIFFGSLPGVLIVSLVRSTNLEAAWLVPLILLLSALLYSVSTIRSGKRFDRLREKITLALSLG